MNNLYLIFVGIQISVYCVTNQSCFTAFMSPYEKNCLKYCEVKSPHHPFFYTVMALEKSSFWIEIKILEERLVGQNERRYLVEEIMGPRKMSEQSQPSLYI